MCVQMNAGTWTQEQLMLATGYRPLEGRIILDKSQLPPPSVMDTWVAAHPIAMQSTYRAVLGTEPAYTSCHGKFIGTVDYVWFTPQVRLTPSACLPTAAKIGSAQAPSPEHACQTGLQSSPPSFQSGG